MPNQTIYHDGYYLSIDLAEPISVVIGLPDLLYPISPIEFIADFRLMLQNDPSSSDWNSQYSNLYKHSDEASGEERYRLRSCNNYTWYW